MKLNYLSNICLAIAFILVNSTSIAGDQTGEDRVKIRKEYNQSLEAPDHVVFGSWLLQNKVIAEKNRLSAAQNIQIRMGYENIDDAMEFLDAILETEAALTLEQATVGEEMICKAAAKKHKQQIYHALDKLDDATELAAQKHYTMFVATLDQASMDGLANWLDAVKLSHYHRTAEHESLFEGTNIHVVDFATQACADMSSAN